MSPALLFLLRRSAANAFRSKLKRLKSPRYFIPTALGTAYFLFIFFQDSLFGRHRDFGEFRGTPDLAAHIPIEWGLTALVAVMASLSWILPVRGAPLAFLEPEVALLFPAPVPRKDLVRFKLLDLQKYLLFVPVFVGLMNVVSQGPVRAGFLAVGSWLTFNALSLHGIGAKMTRLSLAEHGWSGLRRSLVPLGILAAYAAFVGFTMPALPDFAGSEHAMDDLKTWLGRLGESPAGTALLPFRLLVRPFFTADPAEFALRTAALALLVFLLYLWVVRTDVAFEEAAAAQAVTLARHIEAAKKGRLTSGEPGKPVRKNPFPLSPSGPPETAFVWKSVSELLRGVSPRLLVFVFMAAVIAIPISMDIAREHGEAGQGFLGAAAVCMAFLAGILVFVGPSMVGVNLRHDMERVEVLKTFPLTGGRLVRCSLAGTVGPIAALQAILVVGAVLIAPSLPKAEFTVAWRLAAAVLGIVALPAITAISATVDAALVLYFPSWVKPGQQVAQGGMEGMGYGMISGLVKMVALSLGLAIPAGIAVGVGALGVWQGGPLFAPAAAMAGGILGAGLVAGEVWLLSTFLGRRFERFDPAEEGLVA